MVEKNIEKNRGAGDNSFFYCTKCGIKLKSNNNFCNNCGSKINLTQDNTNFMVPNNQAWNSQPRYIKNSPSNDIEWKPIVIGGVIAVVVSALLGFLVGYLMWDADVYTFLGAIIIVNIILLFIGGLYAGVKAIKSGGMHGAFAGALCAIISIPINFIVGIPVDIGSSIFAVFWAMLFAGFGGLIGYRLTKSFKMQPQLKTQICYS